MDSDSDGLWAALGRMMMSVRFSGSPGSSGRDQTDINGYSCSIQHLLDYFSKELGPLFRDTAHMDDQLTLVVRALDQCQPTGPTQLPPGRHWDLADAVQMHLSPGPNGRPDPGGIAPLFAY